MRIIIIVFICVEKLLRVFSSLVEIHAKIKREKQQQQQRLFVDRLNSDLCLHCVNAVVVVGCLERIHRRIDLAHGFQLTCTTNAIREKRTNESEWETTYRRHFFYSFIGRFRLT